MLLFNRKLSTLSLVFIIMLCLSMIVAGCSGLQNVSQPNGGDEDGLEMIDLSGEDGDTNLDNRIYPPVWPIVPEIRWHCSWS